MTLSRSARRPRSVRLSLSTFEDRITPSAVAKYTGIDRTLTITADKADTGLALQLSVTASAGKPTGFLTVTDGNGTPIFTSAGNQPVRTLTVKFDPLPAGVGGSSLTVDGTVKLGANLNVVAARGGTALTSTDATIGGGLYFLGKGGDDHVTLATGAGGGNRVGGKVFLDMGSGDNTVDLESGFVGGGLEVNGLDGDDTVNVLKAGDLRVSGSAAFNLGDGDNVLRAAATNSPVSVLDVGHAFAYKGGTGADAIVFRNTGAPNTFNATLRTGGSATFDLDKSPVPAGDNDLELARLTIGDDLRVTGGGAADTVNFAGPVVTGGRLAVNLREGINSFDPNVNHVASAGNRIGGQFNYAGGAGRDQVRLDGYTVGGSVNVSLGNNPTAGEDIDDGVVTAHQFFKAGEFLGNTFLGAVNVKAGLKSNNIIRLYRSYFSAGIDVQTFDGEDRVRINDSDISGLTHIDTGAGHDVIGIESVANDENANPLSGATTFGGHVRISAGLGDDTVNLGNLNNSTDCVAVFGSQITVDGGTKGNDTLHVGPGVSFLDVKNKDVGFETGGGQLS